MGFLKGMAKGVGGLGRKVAMRSRWLARRLWLVMLADVLLTSRRHWVRLEPEERKRLLELARKSEGRPAKNLTAKERREASELVDKLGHIEYAGNVAGIVLPFRPLSKMTAKFLESRRRKAKQDLAAADAAAGGESEAAPDGAPSEPAPEAASKA